VGKAPIQQSTTAESLLLKLLPVQAHFSSLLSKDKSKNLLKLLVEYLGSSHLESSFHAENVFFKQSANSGWGKILVC